MAVLALSFIDGWLLHDRALGGHGLTALDTVLNAWERRSVPVTSAGVVLAALTGALALWSLRSRSSGGVRLLFIGSLAALALLVASAVPVEHVGQANRVEISAGWPLLVSIALGTVMMLAAALLAAPRPVVLAGAGVLLVAVVAAGSAGRAVGLGLAEGSNRHYADGSYVRAATDGQPTERLTFDGSTYVVGDRWSGNFEGRGLLVTLTDDPACPDVRGAYRVFAEGEADIWWQMIVDPCADGERAQDLQTGIWRRDG